MNIQMRESDYYKWIDVGEHIIIGVQKSKLLNRKYKVKIGWCSLGSKSIAKTEDFYKELGYALEVARKEKRNHD